MIGKLIFWNVRGINDTRKKNIIRSCLNHWKPVIAYLQKTKFESINETTIKNLWSAARIGKQFLPVKGTASGILLVWKKDSVVFQDVHISKITLSCQFSNISNGAFWYFSGVYCKDNELEHSLLWEELASSNGVRK